MPSLKRSNPSTKIEKQQPVESSDSEDEIPVTFECPTDEESVAQDHIEGIPVEESESESDAEEAQLDAFKTNESQVFLNAVERALKADSSENSGVVYLGSIPHGFYEEQMKEYFEQFGKVEKLRLSRNKIVIFNFNF